MSRKKDYAGRVMHATSIVTNPIYFTNRAITKMESRDGPSGLMDHLRETSVIRTANLLDLAKTGVLFGAVIATYKLT